MPQPSLSKSPDAKLPEVTSQVESCWTVHNEGVQLPGLMVAKSTLSLGAEWAKDKALSMTLDRSLGGVLLRYVHQSKHYAVLVPMASISRVELQTKAAE